MLIKALSLYLLLGQLIYSSPPCVSSLQKMFADTTERKIKRLEEAALRLDDIPFDNDIPPERVRLLKNTGELFKILKQISNKNQRKTHFSFWLPFEEALLNDEVLNNPEQARRILQAYNALMRDPDLTRLNLRELVLSNNLVSKKNTIAVLDRLSKFYSLALGYKVDFTDHEQLLRFYGVTKKNELGERIRELTLLNRSRAEILRPVLNAEFTGNEVYERLYSKLLFRIFPDARELPISGASSSFILNRLDSTFVLEVIEGLDLSDELKERYLKALNTVKEKMSQRGDTNRNLKATLALITINAFKDAKGADDYIIRSIFDHKKVSDTHILNIQGRIRHEARVDDIIEVRFSEYVNKVDQLNARRLTLYDSIANARTYRPELISELSLLEGRIPAQNIDDFDIDLEAFERELARIEYQLDQLIERAVSRLEPQEITNFEGLNYRWERLVPGNSYTLEGVDYQSVQFTSSVVEFFNNDPKLGARFLTALKKSYVAIKNSSGLRRLPSIHKDFRDIKLIRSHGKIRIVGRLINGRIYFFHIHNSEEAYKNQQMSTLVENFSP